MRPKLDPRKLFILKVGVGLGVVFLLWGYSADIRQEAEELMLTNEQLREEIEEKKSTFLPSEVINLKENSILRDELLPSLKAQIEFPDTLEPTPKEIDPAIHIKQLISEAQKELKNDAARKSLTIPEKDWDIANKIKKENTPDEISELRLRLCATKKILSTCIGGNVTKVISVKQNARTIEDIENTPYAIARFPVSIQMETDLRGLANLMLAFEKKGNFLELRSLSVKSKQGKEGVLSATVEFAALRFNEREKLVNEAEKKQQTTPSSSGEKRVPRRKF